MPAVVWRAESEAARETHLIIPKWSQAGPRILDSLADWARCDCTILRAEAADAQNLILDGYRFGDHIESSEQFEVPRRKSLGFWNGDAFNSCAVQHHPQGTLESHRSRLQEPQSPEVERFLRRVIWRGSFPLSLRELGQRIAILVSFDPQPPRVFKEREDAAHAALNVASTLLHEAGYRPAPGAGWGDFSADFLKTLYDPRCYEDDLKGCISKHLVRPRSA